VLPPLDVSKRPGVGTPASRRRQTLAPPPAHPRTRAKRSGLAIPWWAETPCKRRDACKPRARNTAGRHREWPSSSLRRSRFELEGFGRQHGLLRIDNDRQLPHGAVLRPWWRDDKWPLRAKNPPLCDFLSTWTPQPLEAARCSRLRKLLRQRPERGPCLGTFQPSVHLGDAIGIIRELAPADATK
jgi:hypothetical protein